MILYDALLCIPEKECIIVEEIDTKHPENITYAYLIEPSKNQRRDLQNVLFNKVLSIRSDTMNSRNIPSDTCIIIEIENTTQKEI